MALVLGCASQDESKRSLLMRNFRKIYTESKNLHTTSYDDDTLSLVCAAPATMPVSIFKPQEHAVCAVFGAVNEARVISQDPARYLASLATEKGPSAISGRDGYYLALYKEGNTTTIATDALGYYPLYWFKHDDVVLFASAPGLFTFYPEFTIRPSAEGIAAVLMTMHVIGDQTALEGVRRLPGGTLLQVHRDLAVRTVNLPAFRPAPVDAKLAEADAIAAVQDVFARSVQRSSAIPANIMLSGGMDSRLIAGAYRNSFAGEITGVTFARSGDFESFCAANVARSLSMKHIVHQGTYAAFPEQAMKQCGLERSSNSLANLSWCAGLPVFSRLGRPVLTGLVGDAVMGASHVEWAFDAKNQNYSFDCLWQKIRRFGASDELVQRLLAPIASKEILQEVKNNAQKIYDSVEGEPWQKAWMFDLHNRQRFHVVSAAWRLSLRAWAELPFYNLELLELMSRIPYELQKGRRLQKKLLMERYRKLAELPLDRNAIDTRPLIPSFKGTALNLTHKLMRRLSGSTEDRRTYYREYDFNNEGWSLVRAAAEPSRAKLRLLLDADAVDELLPTAGIPVHCKDMIIDAAKMKSLLGLALSLNEMGLPAAS